MEIKLFGDKTIFLKGKKESVLVNPSEKEVVGNKINARIVIYSHQDLNQPGIEGERIIINGSGEYEIGGVEVSGIGVEDDKTIYVVTIDGFRLVVIAELAEELSEKKIEKVDEADIMLTTIKVGEKVNFKLLRDWAKKWGVNYLIPLSEETESIKRFLDDADEEGLVESESLKLDKVDDLPDGFEVKLLKKN
ncbi:MAG TPA: MBL fold metallo-hydrolase [Candidatus Woesebacteria bacterium]|jgi:hypothetical protein|nr:MBL fold metallo-hydrolase [Candidatus Shapirobacteria bacterium]HOR02058.1 MBL fold metallo-hydrolase [Candidatus Woesebacteria bacterium]